MKEIDSDSDDGFDIDYVFDDDKKIEKEKDEREQHRISNGRNRSTMKSKINR